MKNWEIPKMTIYNVKMNENIAASGDGSDSYEKVHLYYDVAGITRGGADYWCSGTVIQDTGISYTFSEYGSYVDYSQTGTISGCLA